MASAQFRINRHNKKSYQNLYFFIKISNFLSAIAVIPLTVNKIASSGGFGPLYTSFPLYGSPLNGSFTVLLFAHFEGKVTIWEPPHRNATFPLL